MKLSEQLSVMFIRQRRQITQILNQLFSIHKHIKNNDQHQAEIKYQIQQIGSDEPDLLKQRQTQHFSQL